MALMASNMTVPAGHEVAQLVEDHVDLGLGEVKDGPLARDGFLPAAILSGERGEFKEQVLRLQVALFGAVSRK